MRDFIIIGMILLFAAAVPADPAPADNIGYTKRANVPYGGDHARQKLDIYAPPGAEKLPVMVFIHGGGWRIGDKRGVGMKPRFFTGEGMVFVSINYRLGPEFIHPVLVEDVAAALAWLHDNIASHGGDPERIWVMGHSAGAHLAALAATDARRLRAHGKEPGIIKGVVLIDGAGYDVPAQIATAMGPLRKTYRSAFTDDPAVQRDASPVHHAGKYGAPPPFLILHVADRAASRRQSNALAKALRAAGGKAVVFAAEGKNHMSINRDIGAEGDPVTAAILEFLHPPVE